MACHWMQMSSCPWFLLVHFRGWMLSAANHTKHMHKDSLFISSAFLCYVSRIKENHMSIPIWCYSLLDNDDTFFLLLFRLFLLFFCSSVCPYHQSTYRTLVLECLVLCSSSNHVSSTSWAFHLFCSFFPTITLALYMGAWMHFCTFSTIWLFCCWHWLPIMLIWRCKVGQPTWFIDKHKYPNTSTWAFCLLMGNGT